MLKGKTVLLGITGSIAAYKIAYLASALHKLHADVHVLMTENATNFINPITFETLTGNKCLVDTFDRNFQFQVEHVSIAIWKAGQRPCRRYAHHYGNGLQVSKNPCTGHEYRHV